MIGLEINNYSKYKTIFSSEQRNAFKLCLEKFTKKIKSNDIRDINEAIFILINKEINIEDENTIKNLNISNEKTPTENILIFLMKYPFRFKTSDKFKQNLFEIFKIMYKYAEGRKIEKYFEINIKNENIKLFLEKLSYIISFTLLCLSPGELLEYEYKEDYENILNEIKKNILNEEKKIQKINLNYILIIIMKIVFQIKI